MTTTKRMQVLMQAQMIQRFTAKLILIVRRMKHAFGNRLQFTIPTFQEGFLGNVNLDECVHT